MTDYKYPFIAMTVGFVMVIISFIGLYLQHQRLEEAARACIVQLSEWVELGARLLELNP